MIRIHIQVGFSSLIKKNCWAYDVNIELVRWTNNINQYDFLLGFIVVYVYYNAFYIYSIAIKCIFLHEATKQRLGEHRTLQVHLEDNKNGLYK